MTHPTDKNPAHTSLIIVDVQHDFCPGGALATARGHEVAARIGELQRSGEYSTVVSTQDWHIDPEGHFSPEPDFVDTWPVHCVAGTPGAELHPDIEPTGLDERFLKGEYTAAYSGFEGRAASDAAVSLAQWLRSRDITQVDVVGIATDYCVRATALDALKEGFGVTLIMECCSAVDEAATDKVIAELSHAGATFR